jgi:putative Holliday junction resolvase
MEYTFSIKEFINKAGAHGSLLGLDHGTKRIGLGISDPDREFTFPLSLISDQTLEGSVLTIARIVKEKSISGIVVGYPLQPDGQEGEQCKKVKAFAEALLQQISIPIFFQDERFSSKGAHTMLKELNLTKKQRNERDDELAACNILQTAINLMKNL